MASSATFNITVRGAVLSLAQRLQNASRQMADLRVPYKKASVYLDQWVQKNFQTEGGKVGGWLPLRAGGRWVGKGDSRRFDSRAKILKDTGALRHSFMAFSSNRDAGIRSKLSYAAKHEYGDKTTGLPQRRMLPKKKEVMADVKDIFTEHYKTVAKDITK